MKFFHLSDLHIGKQLHHYSLLEEQKHILKQMVELAETESPGISMTFRCPLRKRLLFLMIF